MHRKLVEVVQTHLAQMLGKLLEVAKRRTASEAEMPHARAGGGRGE